MSMLSRRTWKLSHQAFLGFGYNNKPPLNSSSSQILILLLLVPRSVTTGTTNGRLPRHHYIGQEEENGWRRFQKSPNRTTLTPQIVKSTLLNCPSDLIALTFFFWCARQRDYFHDRFSFHHMVDILTRLTNRFGGSVRDLLHHLNAVGIVTGPRVLMLLLRIYWHGRKDVHIFQTFEEIVCHGYTPNTYARNICMDALFKIERVTMALAVLKGTPLPNFLTYSIALSNLCRLGDLINLPYVLRSMLRAGYYPNADTFYVLLSCFCKRGKVAEALQLYSMMMTLGVPVSVKTWSILIDGFCRSGRLVMAGHVLDKMVKSGCFPNVVTWTSFIKAFMESGNLDASLSVLRLMELEGHSPDLVLYNVLIDGLSKTGRYDDALDCYVQLVKQKLIPDSYTFCSVMSLVSLSRKFDLLPTLFSGLSVETDLVVFNSILSFFCKTGCPSGAVEFYDNMVDRGLLPDKYSFSELLRGLCGAGRTDTAVNVYRRIVMEDVCVDAHVHTIIIDGLIKSGNLSTAITLFREAVAKKYPLDVVSYTVAINGLLKADRLEEAYTLYNLMKASGITPNAKTHNAMISGLCRGRDVEKVRQILQEMIGARTQINNIALNMINNLLLKACCPPSIHSQLISLVDSLMPHSASSVLVVQGDSGSVDFGSISGHDELHDVAASSQFSQLRDLEWQARPKYQAEGFAFSHCTECRAVFILRANVPPDRWWLRSKFQLLVARDHAFIFVIVQLIVAFLGVLVYKFYGDELREMFGYEGHTYGFYTMASNQYMGRFVV